MVTSAEFRTQTVPRKFNGGCIGFHEAIGLDLANGASSCWIYRGFERDAKFSAQNSCLDPVGGAKNSA
ncbi:MAG: hypothetical protein ACI8UO_001635 [Verrucomicrobiales bacterium]